ncbi:MAG: serine/threonine-protein kinase [Pseudomonadota bacterium]
MSLPKAAGKFLMTEPDVQLGVAYATIDPLNDFKTDAELIEQVTEVLIALEKSNVKHIVIITPALTTRHKPPLIDKNIETLSSLIKQLRRQGKIVLMGVALREISPQQFTSTPGLLSAQIEAPFHPLFAWTQELQLYTSPNFFRVTEREKSLVPNLPMAWIRETPTSISQLVLQSNQGWLVNLAAVMKVAKDQQAYQNIVMPLGSSDFEKRQGFSASLTGRIIFDDSVNIPTYPVDEGLSPLMLMNHSVIIGHSDDKAAIDTAKIFASLDAGRYLSVPWWTQLSILLIAIVVLGIWNLPSFYNRHKLYIRLTAILIVILFALQVGALLGFQWWVPYHYLMIGLGVMTWITLQSAQQANFIRRLRQIIHEKEERLLQVFIKNKQFLSAKAQIGQVYRSKPAPKGLLVSVADGLVSQNYIDEAKAIYHAMLHTEHKAFAEKKLIGLTPEKTLVMTAQSPAKRQSTNNTAVQFLNMKQTIGRYRLKSVIGKGAMGTVFLAMDTKIKRQVALKTISLDGEFEGEDLETVQERFVREANAAGKLRHPNIVTIYDIDSEEGLMYIAMDYVPGSNLADTIKREEFLLLVEVYDITLQVAYALQYAHDQGVVHRDIKPANILYESMRQHVTVMDFGIALVTDHSKTRTGTVMGSPAYMSPEQIKGEKVNGKTDVYSLGVTFYQLLSHQLPFEGDSITSLSFNIVNNNHKPIRKVRKDLPRSAAVIINKALQKSAQQRCSLEEMISLLKRELDRLKKKK